MEVKASAGAWLQEYIAVGHAALRGSWGGGCCHKTELLCNFTGVSQAQTRLADVGMIVLDEVHYLGDPSRGSVWEEVIINCPKHIQLCAMSATVANADALGGWIDEVLSCSPGSWDAVEVFASPAHLLCGKVHIEDSVILSDIETVSGQRSMMQAEPALALRRCMASARRWLQSSGLSRCHGSSAISTRTERVCCLCWPRRAEH